MKKYFLVCFTLAFAADVSQTAEKSKRVQSEIPSSIVYGNATYDMTRLSQLQKVRYEKILKMAEEAVRQQALKDFFEGIAEVLPDAVVQDEQQLAAQLVEQQEALRLQSERAYIATEEALRKKEQVDQLQLDELITTIMGTGASFEQALIEAQNEIAGTVRAPIAVRVLDRYGQKVETQAERCARGEHGACSCVVEDARAAEEVPVACGVCLDDLQNGSPLASTLCAHTFHEGCLNQALVTKPLCPECKMDQRDSGAAAAAMSRAAVQDFDADEVARAIELSKAQTVMPPTVADIDARALLQADEALALQLQQELNKEVVREEQEAQRRLKAERLRVQQLRTEQEQVEQVRREQERVKQLRVEQLRREQERAALQAAQRAQEDEVLRRSRVGFLQKFFQKPVGKMFQGEENLVEQLEVRLAQLLGFSGETPQTAREKIWSILRTKYGITKEDVLALVGRNEPEARVSLATTGLDLLIQERLLAFFKNLLPEYN